MKTDNFKPPIFCILQPPFTPWCFYGWIDGNIEIGSIIQKCLFVIFEKNKRSNVMWSKRKMVYKERKPSTVLKSIINTIS